MNYNFNFLHVCLCWALTLTITGILLVMGIKSIFTGAWFPSHQLLILAMFWCMSMVQTGPRELVLFRKIYRLTTRVASSILSRMAIFAKRATEAVALFFTVNPSNRPQTEP